MGILLVAAILLLSFGWGLLRPLAERRATAALDRPVSIARIARVGGGLLHPVLAIEGVRIGQPAWAGSGDMVRLRQARVRVAALSLLAGRIEPQVTLMDGLRATLIRTADGRANWQRSRKGAGGGEAPDLGHMLVRDAILSVDDRKHRHRFTLSVTIDEAGLRIAGPGQVGDTPAELVVRGPAVGGSGPWPFDLDVRSAAVTLRAHGHMRKPLDLAHFEARVASKGRDLVDLDHLIQAGLPATQDYDLTAQIAHDGARWMVRALRGTIGRSDVDADLDIDRESDGRMALTGSVKSRGFDFDDLSSDADLANARAKAKRIGPRLIPDTRIDLTHLRRTDAVIHVDIARILSRDPTVFRSVRGTVTLDHGVLTAPLAATLVAGTLTGTLSIRHQSGLPLFGADLTLRDGRLERLVHTNGILTGPLVGRARLTGRGETVRSAMARGDGRIGLVSRDGAMTRRVALLLGADVGRGIFAGNTDRTGLRCLIADMAVTNGIVRPAPLVIDTDVARADGSGRLTFADERVAIDLAGRPKRESALRLNGPIEARGTIEQPTINPPPQTKSVGGILKMVGKALGGHQAPLATDANCAALAAHALR